MSAVGFLDFVRGSLPEGPARVCVVAEEWITQAIASSEIDLYSPIGPGYADLGEQVFDAVVVEDAIAPGVNLIGEVAAIARIVRPQGLLVLNGFAWDLLNTPTAAWFYEQRRQLAAADRGPDVHPTLYEFRRWWTEEAFVGVPAHHELRYALYEYFEELVFEWTPGLYEYLDGAASLALERRLIEARQIRALGFRYLGRRRAEVGYGTTDALAVEPTRVVNG